MDFKTGKETVTINETILNSVYEQPVELDCTLADYYPDVVRILKCDVTARVLSKQPGADALTIEGVACVDIYYCSREGGLQCLCQQVPFTKVVELKQCPAQFSCDVTAAVNYVNVRAVNERRITLRGALSLKVKVTGFVPYELLSSTEGGGVELHQRQAVIDEPVAAADQYFDLKEEVPMGAGLPPAATVLKTVGDAQVEEYKVISGKLILKGEILLKTLYLPEEEGARPQLMMNSLPLNQIIDLEGATEDSTPEAWLEVIGASALPKAGGEGEATLSVDVQLCAHVRCMRERRLTYVDDAYSTLYESQMETAPVALQQLAEQAKDSLTVKDTLDLSDTGVESVTDVRCTAVITGVEPAENGVELLGKLTVLLFYYAGDGMPRVAEKQVDFSYRKELGALPEKWECDARATAQSSSFTLVGADRIELRVQCGVEFTLRQVREISALTGIQVLEDSPLGDGPGAPLILYYADQGEDVWEIAKAYRTSASRIVEENDLAGTVLEKRRMLLIPAVR